jgi:hypothetical protein
MLGGDANFFQRLSNNGMKSLASNNQGQPCVIAVQQNPCVLKKYGLTQCFREWSARAVGWAQSLKA